MSINTAINPLLSSVLKRGVISNVKDIEKPDFVAKDMRTTMEKVKEISWAVFTWVIFPLALLHYAVGLVVLPVSSFGRDEGADKQVEKAQKGELLTLDHTGQVKWSKYYDCKRVSLKTSDGVTLDGMVLVRKGRQAIDRWTVNFNPNGAKYEDFLGRQGISAEELSDQLNSNILLFNYRGVGHSSGWATREGLIRDGEAALQLVEKLGAKEVITYGLSLGGGVSLTALAKHQKQEGVKYLTVVERSFTRLSLAARNIVQEVTCRPLAWVVKWLFRIVGWEINAMKAFEKIDHERIVVYHPQDGMMAGDAGLGPTLAKKRYEDLVAFDADGEELDFYFHMPIENALVRSPIYKMIGKALQDEEVEKVVKETVPPLQETQDSDFTIINA